MKKFYLPYNLRELSQPSTSIGELFRFDLMVMKLCGGCLFDAPILWYVATLYKLTIIIILQSIVFREEFHSPFDRMTMDSKAAEANTKVFDEVALIGFWCTIATSFIGSIRTREFMQILVQKRIYVANKSFRTDLLKAAPLPNPFKLSRNQSAHPSPMPAVSKMQSARIYLYTYFVFMALSATLTWRYDSYYSSTHLTNEPSIPSSKILIDCGRGDMKPSDDSRPNSTARHANHASSLRPLVQLYARQMSDLADNLAVFLIDSLALIPGYLKRLTLVAATAYFVYGRMITTLYITAFMSDLLCATRLLQSNNDDFGIHETSVEFGSASKVRGVESRMASANRILVQIRDTSLALRSVIRNEYLFVCLSARGAQMQLFSYIIAFIACRQYIWLALRFFELIMLYMGMFTARIGFIWMHAEAREFSVLSERQLIDATKQRHSNQESSGRYYWALINYRLAAEIEEIWPTDWLKPDVVSFLSDLLNSFIFAAGIYQLIEMGVQVQSLRTTS